MSNTLLIKRSAVAAKVPTTAQMSVGELAVNTFDGALYLKGNNGSDFITKVGGLSAPAVSGGSTWQAVAGFGPVGSYEFDELVWLYTQGSSQAMTVWLRIPTTYSAGRQISLKLAQYSPGTANTYRLQTTSTLVRKGVDAVTSVTNSRTSTNGDVTLTTANLYQEVIYDLTDAAGKINAVAVSPGDLVKVVLTRVAPSGTEDSNDVRAVPSSTEFTF
jgi:hypothetical protein